MPRFHGSLFFEVAGVAAFMLDAAIEDVADVVLGDALGWLGGARRQRRDHRSSGDPREADDELLLEGVTLLDFVVRCSSSHVLMNCSASVSSPIAWTPARFLYMLMPTCMALANQPTIVPASTVREVLALHVGHHVPVEDPAELLGPYHGVVGSSRVWSAIGSSWWERQCRSQLD